MKLRLNVKYSLATVSLIIIIVSILVSVLLYQFSSLQNNLTVTSSKAMSANLLEQMERRCEGITRLLATTLVNSLYLYDMQSMFELLQATLQQNNFCSHTCMTEMEKLYMMVMKRF